MSSKSAPFQILRVEPGGKVKPGILAAQRLILQGGGQIAAAADHTHYALVGQPAEQLLPIRVKLRIVIMGVGVKNQIHFFSCSKMRSYSRIAPFTDCDTGRKPT